MVNFFLHKLDILYVATNNCVARKILPYFHKKNYSESS